MSHWTRRDLLKSGLAAAGASVLTPELARALAAARGAPSVGDAPTGYDAPVAAQSPRERLLLDRGWRFLLGHAADPAPEFGSGNGNGFGKAGDLFTPSNPKLDVS